MMPPKAIGFGLALILIGAIGFYHSGFVAHTALIPAWIGLALAILGVVGLKENIRKHAMHFAAMVSLLGAVGALVSLIRGLIKGGAAPVAQISQGLTALLCALFVYLCVQSFIAARRAREASNT